MLCCAGPAAGTALVSLASTTGAAAAFLVSRYLARPWVEDKLRGERRVRPRGCGCGRGRAGTVAVGFGRLGWKVNGGGSTVVWWQQVTGHVGWWCAERVRRWQEDGCINGLQ